MSRSFVLGERLEALIDTLVRSGRYQDGSDVVRDALRRLEDETALDDAQTARWREAIAAARDGSAPVDAQDVFDRLEAKYRAMEATQAPPAE